MIDREDTPPGPVRRPRFGPGRRVLVVVLLALVALLLSLRGLANFWTDYLWFSSVGFAPVWSTLLVTKIVLAVIGIATAFALLLGNLWLAQRVGPELAPSGPGEQLVLRYRSWAGSHRWWVLLGASGFFGLILGLGAVGWWEDWLLFTNAQSFGVTDPVFSRDIGFYVFQVPFLRDLFGWLFQFVVVTAVVVAAFYYLSGAIRVHPRGLRVAPGVKVHLSVLLAVLAMLKAVGYWLDQFDLLYSERGAVFGAAYTDIHARLPAVRLLFFISLFAALLLLVNIRFRGWIVPAAAVGLWLVTSIALGGIWPAAVQRFSVQPDEINKELPYIERNIAATRTALGLSGVEQRSFAADQTLTADDLALNAATIDNVRLWDPAVLLTTYRQLQELRPFYQFGDVDVDRYRLDGEITQVMVSPRELDEADLPGSGWVNRHLVFTHGYGAVVSPANSVTVEGQPAFLVKDITQDDGVPEVLSITQPRVYFGEAIESSNFVIVGTKEQEVDYPLESGGGEATFAFNSYDGEGGIRMGSFFRRAAFALRFADLNTLISGQITGESRVLMVRNIRDIVEKAAPFLYADADPYTVIVDGNLVWLIDLYTVTDRYPYSTRAFTGRLSAQNSGLPTGFNYVRNSVKATVDAYDGTVTFYVVDEADPILGAYRSIFPSLFTPMAEMPAVLQEHLRYPEDLFRVQGDMFQRYHVTDPRVFFNNTLAWQVAKDPSNTPREALRVAYGADSRPMVPYYLLMRLPGETDLSYLALQPFTAAARPNMVSFLVAKGDPDEYGDLISFELPADSFVDGPGQVGARINQDPEVSEQFTLWGREGSEVVQGNMLVVPVEESILYVQPIYLQARSEGTGNSTGIPEFKRVVVVFGNQIVMRETLAQALTEVFGEETTPTTTTTTQPGGGEISDQVRALLDRAQAAFVAADTALRNGDLAGYAARVAEAQALVQQAVGLLGGS
ncbi:MAG: UPF0182 family protein [Acidimicrobiia bacterium]|jgi:hypothetical protein|nr:UPF0182 family protein [Acidimicrobiia bacterium]